MKHYLLAADLYCGVPRVRELGKRRCQVKQTRTGAPDATVSGGAVIVGALAEAGSFGRKSGSVLREPILALPGAGAGEP
eukprot:CAMPEP_0205930464 /NCGR_PEP_ID=MMETSP1325-20131115/25909_1 /ASSEMBLY_ACC=CAM_ASM_000708 /TAXON_ID=236786 /ORGANISM="Florenciella sp., Strain RCC1007" /LENGTH=78 /DNA_ID=CAMNT_0053299849 /DNA_START=173 /DNA_END=407 /DNA_ORIENTATION=-